MNALVMHEALKTQAMLENSGGGASRYNPSVRFSAACFHPKIYRLMIGVILPCKFRQENLWQNNIKKSLQWYVQKVCNPKIRKNQSDPTNLSCKLL